MDDKNREVLRRPRLPYARQKEGEPRIALMLLRVALLKLLRMAADFSSSGECLDGDTSFLMNKTSIDYADW